MRPQEMLKYSNSFYCIVVGMMVNVSKYIFTFKGIFEEDRGHYI